VLLKSGQPTTFSLLSLVIKYYNNENSLIVNKQWLQFIIKMKNSVFPLFFSFSPLFLFQIGLPKHLTVEEVSRDFS
jgi:hypothetical protein